MLVKLDIKQLRFKAIKKHRGMFFNPIFRYDPAASVHMDGRVLYLTDREGGRYYPNEDIELYVDISEKEISNGRKMRQESLAIAQDMEKMDLGISADSAHDMG